MLCSERGSLFLENSQRDIWLRRDLLTLENSRKKSEGAELRKRGSRGEDGGNHGNSGKGHTGADSAVFCKFVCSFFLKDLFTLLYVYEYFA